MLPAPVWLSLLFDGCICHFGLVFQTRFSSGGGSLGGGAGGGGNAQVLLLPPSR